VGVDVQMLTPIVCHPVRSVDCDSGTMWNLLLAASCNLTFAFKYVDKLIHGPEILIYMNYQACSRPPSQLQYVTFSSTKASVVQVY